MKRKPEDVAKTPDELDQKLKAANNRYNPELVKQITSTYTDRDMSPDDEASLAKDTVYRVWRDFLCAYQAARYPTESHPDPKVRRTYEDFGDLDCDFEDWWKDEGRELFLERGELPLVKILQIDRDWGGDGGYPKHITLQIPLTIPKEGIIEQLKSILDQCHLGSDLYRHRHSTALYKLYPRSHYKRGSFEKMLRVWELVEQHRTGKSDKEQMPWWEIAHKAELNPKINPFKNTDEATKDEARRALAKLAIDLSRQAQGMMENAIRGVFPWDKKLRDHAVAGGDTE